MAVKSITEEFVDFSNSTSCHGLSQVTEQHRSRVGRLLWSLLIMACCTCMILQLREKVAEYTEYTANTEINEEFLTKVEFPSVTICNFNRFFNISSNKELAVIDALLRSTTTSTDHKFDSWWQQQVRMWNKKFYLSNEFHIRGWQLNSETIQKCSFKQESCSYKNFTKVLTPMGVCFKFTPDKKIYQLNPGSTFGLLLTLDIKQELYSEHPRYGKAEAGVKVLVHNKHEIPLVNEFGIAVPSGHAAHIVIKKILRSLMYKPWGVCTPNAPTLKHYGAYTFKACMRECRLSNIIGSCGCAPYWAPNKRELSECDADQTLKCAGPIEANFTQFLSVDKCGCVQLCNSTSFDSHVSYATYPSVEVGEILANERYVDETKEVKIWNQSLTEEKDPNFVKLERYRQNHLQIDIYYDSLSFMKISQSKKVTEVSLLSDIGGILGLWLGISVVTIVEIYQFLIKSGRTWIRSISKVSTSEAGGERENTCNDVLSAA